MKTNMGSLDRIIRILAAVAVLVLYSMKQISGTAAIILLIFAGVFIITSFVGFCPLYSLFGMRTTRK
jgi:hypothetical protein